MDGEKTAARPFVVVQCCLLFLRVFGHDFSTNTRQHNTFTSAEQRRDSRGDHNARHHSYTGAANTYSYPDTQSFAASVANTFSYSIADTFSYSIALPGGNAIAHRDGNSNAGSNGNDDDDTAHPIRGRRCRPISCNWHAGRDLDCDRYYPVYLLFPRA